jgi:predicted nucleic acid-binding protein
MERALLDSNVIIGYLAGRIPEAGMRFVSAIVDQAPHISVISQIEVLRFNDTPGNEKVLTGFINASITHPLSPDIVRLTIRLCRQSKIKLPDAIIAATALFEDRVLITRDIDDCKHITNLTLVNPWELEAV